MKIIFLTVLTSFPVLIYFMWIESVVGTSFTSLGFQLLFGVSYVHLIKGVLRLI